MVAISIGVIFLVAIVDPISYTLRKGDQYGK
jgi:hypothetical protein